MFGALTLEEILGESTQQVQPYVQYYLIHCMDKERESFMLEQFKRVNIDNNKVKWIKHPNKNEIDQNFIRSVVIPGISTTCCWNINAQASLRPEARSVFHYNSRNKIIAEIAPIAPIIVTINLNI
jgi:hypothetical protein